MRYVEPALGVPKPCSASAVPRTVATVPSGLLVVVVLGVVGLRRWGQYGHFAPGLDPGNWFALGRDLLGDGGKSTPYGYPPLVPVLLHLGQLLAPPMLVAKIVAIASLIAVVAATHAVTRAAVGTWFALTTAATVGLAGILTETTAFGGYPQNFALAFLLLAAFAVARYLATGSAAHARLAAVTLLSAALSHHMYFLLTCGVVVAVGLGWLCSRPPSGTMLRRTLGTAVSASPALAAFAPTLLSLRSAGYRPPVNASALDLETALRMAVREAPHVWATVLFVGLAYVALTWRRLSTATHRVASATTVVATPVFLLTFEERVLPLLIVGSTMAWGLALHDAWRSGRASAWCGVPIALAVLVPILLWPASDALAAEQYRYYRIVDEPLLKAASYVDAHHREGLVVVRHDRRGWPLGWWFEGLTGARIVVGSDPRWLAFPLEQERARLADRFFAGRRTAAEATALAAETGVELLVFRKWEWIGWERWLSDPKAGVEVVYDDGQFMILALVPDPHAAEATDAYQSSASRA